MTSEPAGVARPRLKPTDLDAIDPSRRRLELRPSRPSRFALHLLQEAANTTNAARAVEAARKELDLLPSDPSAVMHLFDWLGSEPPRGIPWTSYPVVAAPAYAIRLASPVPTRLSAGRPSEPCPINRLAEHVDTVIVHLPDRWEGSSRDLYPSTPDGFVMAGRVIDSLGPDVSISLVHGKNVVGGAAELRALIAAHEPATRFRYSYAANFAAIACPALEHALAKPDRKALAFVSAATTWHGDAKFQSSTLERVRKRQLRPFLIHPFALQILYDLQRRGKAPVTTEAMKSSGSPWQTELVFGRGAGCAWKGTGKYEPMPMSEHLTRRIATSLAETMLLRKDRSSICLSDTGKAFLDAIHPDCEDLDLPMRWTAHPPTPEDVEAMDAWIARRFRRMKTRVNALVSHTRKPKEPDPA